MKCGCCLSLAMTRNDRDNQCVSFSLIANLSLKYLIGGDEWAGLSVFSAFLCADS